MYYTVSGIRCEGYVTTTEITPGKHYKSSWNTGQFKQAFWQLSQFREMTGAKSNTSTVTKKENVPTTPLT